MYAEFRMFFSESIIMLVIYLQGRKKLALLPLVFVGELGASFIFFLSINLIMLF